MRRSAAPSQLNKLQTKPSFFSPPYKSIVPPAKRHCAAASLQNEECKRETPVSERKVSPVKDTGRSSTDLLKLIKPKNHPKQDKENVFTRTSTNKDEKKINLPNITNSYPTGEKSISTDEKSSEGESGPQCRYFSVVWCKLSKKKHKKWEGDAILIVKSRSVVLKDMEGKEIGRSSGYKLKDLESLEEGNTLPVGAKEIEIQGEIEHQKYISGKCFQSAGLAPEEVVETPVQLKPKPKPFRLPVRNGSSGSLKSSKGLVKPLYDIHDASAIVLPKPPSRHQWSHNSEALPVIDVVVDPFIGSKLRPHQISGVVFLYECVMGFRTNDYKGAILADEMGLGKTLQCITLIWTLLKQGPYGGVPVLKRVLVVTPSSLVANWGKEFEKWLGSHRIKTYEADQHNKAANFANQSLSPVLIISYEMLVRCIDQMKQIKFDLILCDEGHRLKNAQIKTTSLLSALNIQRRVILTGTPIQNDLQEFYSLVEFVNPGILGSSAMFRKVYEDPIVKSQQPAASLEEKEIGESRAAELNRLSSRFTLRRTQEIINKYLPPKTEFVVFCQPAKTQTELYEAVVGSRGLQRCLMNSETGDHLSAICILRKLCNHPRLLCVGEEREHLSDIQKEISSLIPEEITQSGYLEEDSAKLAVVSCILWSLSEYKGERIVIVSNFTTTLNMLQELCERYKYPFLRLDGSTPSSKRQNLVDRFNRASCQEFVFLLSAKAGGMGLNLIGASRILLFDIDWNPATDLQAMARVWRDGQKRNVFIYRLILAGSLEEKMFQRQVCKQGISGCVVDARNNCKVQFSAEELKDLFKFHPNVRCLTHDLLECPCDQRGGEDMKLSPSPPLEKRECQLLGGNEAVQRAKSTTMDQLFKWQHFSVTEETDPIDDPFLESGRDFISFVFKSQIMEENTISQE